MSFVELPLSRLRVAVAALVLLLFAGCGGSSNQSVVTQPVSAQPELATVRLLSALAQTTVPSQVDQLRVRGFDDQQRLLYGPEVRSKAAQIEFAGVPIQVSAFVIEYLAAGRVVGIAQVAVNLSKDQTLVIDNPDIIGVSGAIQSLSVSPGSITLAAGTSDDFTLTGHFGDGSSQNLTSAATWSSSDQSVATVAGGKVTGLVPGSSTIRAALAGFTVEAQVQVTDAHLVALQLSPLSPAIAKGTNQAFGATGVYSDGSVQVLTGQVKWSSSDQSIATIDGTGLADGLDAGQTTITATMGAVAQSTVLTVTPATLTDLVIEGPSSASPAGSVVQLTAKGSFSDGSQQNLTSLVAWQSNNPTLASITGPGTVKTLQQGNAQIQASYQGFTPTFALSISAAEVTSIEVRTVGSAASSVIVGDTLQLEAIATLTDQTTSKISGPVTWSSEQTGVAGVDSGTGLVSGLATGQSGIVATFAGTGGPVTGRLVVTVIAPPQLTLTTGAHSFDTDTGILTLQGHSPVVAQGWNSTDHRLELDNFIVGSGATLRITGSNPFLVRAQGDITVEGVLDAHGTDGVTGSGGSPGSAAGDGGDGSAGGGLVLAAVGNLTYSGTANIRGGNGGAGGSLSGTVGGFGDRIGGRGGNGGSEGTVSLNAGGTLVNSMTLVSGGGDGGNGGDVTEISTLPTPSSITAGDGGAGGSGTVGGDGGRGGNATVGGTVNAPNTVRSGSGGVGGIGAISGGDGGDAGNISVAGTVNTPNTVIAGNGGVGGSGGINGGHGGQGGSIYIGGDVNSPVNTVAGGSGGAGGIGGTAGDGGNGGDVNVIGNAGVSVTGGNGGAGGEGFTIAGNGGNGGSVTVGSGNSGSGGSGGIGGEGVTRGFDGASGSP